MNPTLLKFLNIFGVAAFSLFAWLQREDDNPDIYVQPSLVDVVLWVGFYGLVALAFGLAVVRKFPRWLFLAIVLLGLFHLATTIPGVLQNFSGGGLEMAKESMSPERAEVELSREFFGVLIAFIATALIWIQRPKSNKA